MLRKTLAILILITLNMLVLYGTWLNAQKKAITPEAMAADHVPDFTWQDLEGKRHAIGELKDHAVVIHFWATWCAPCRKEFPELLKAAKELDKHVLFLTISGDESVDSAKAFVKKMQAETQTEGLENVLFAVDPDKHIAMDVFQTAVYPESILLDPTLTMRHKFTGAAKWQDKEVLKLLENL